MSRAASTPSLGAASTYGVLSSIYTNTSSTTINGDVGFTTGPAVAPGGVHANYGSGGPYVAAGTNQDAALNTLNSDPFTFFWGSAVDLSTETTHGTIGVFTPGVYCSAGAMSITADLTLSGSGTYIFKAVGALNTSAGASVILADGASACNVFWTPTAATTLGANTNFVGTNIDNAGITVGANTNWIGRALAYGGTVTTDTATMTTPLCTPAPATINVVKTVINDNGKTKGVNDFPLYIDGAPITSGATNTFAPGTHAVTETVSTDYTQSFSGDCDANGNVAITPGDNAFCIITNDDIAEPIVVPPVPPIIEVVKVPSPLTLPSGPGLVDYTFTVRNLGTVTIADITMTDDSCSPTLTSGDANTNAQLETSETWIYTCSKTLLQTHTNNAVVTGWANGLSSTDIASSTVVVGAAIVPPLIHVTKIPAPLTVTYGGGAVTYTEKITNPGTAPLSNITITDDKCSPLQYVSGDTNGDSLLDPAEAWVYTCTATITKTTTNIAEATGQANDLTGRDFAIATVVVAGAIPGLPNTGR